MESSSSCPAKITPQVLGNLQAEDPEAEVEHADSAGLLDRRPVEGHRSNEDSCACAAASSSDEESGPVTSHIGDEVAEDANELPTPKALSPKERVWAVGLLLFSAFDLLGSAVLACFAFTYAFHDEGVSLYCIGIQAISHMCSSLALVLRFMPDLLPPREDDSPASDGCLLRERRRRDLGREQCFAMAMGIAMMVSCVAMLFKAVRKIQLWDVWYFDHHAVDQEIEHVTEIIAWWGFGCFFFQALFRGFAARRLRQSAVWNSLAVSVVSLVFFLVLGAAVSYQREWSWKAEPIAAMVLVVVLMLESIRMVIANMGDIDIQLRSSLYVVETGSES